MIGRLLTLFLIASLAALVVSAQAVVVTVTPDNMQGWSIDAYRQGTGAIVPYGPAAWEGGTRWDSKENGNGTPLGRGAFYATCHPSQGAVGATGAEKTPSTVWLGTDTGANGQSLVGIALSRITRLTYFVFVEQNPWRTANSTQWDDDTSWRGPREPIMFAVTVVAPDGTDRRTFYCRPWGSQTIGDDNAETYWQDRGPTRGRWEYHTLTDIGRPTVAWGTWWDPWANKRYSWSEIAGPTGIFKDYTLAPTSSDPWPTGFKSPGWDTDTDPQGTPHECTGTGKCINLMVGARKRMVKWPESPNSGQNWWWESAGFRGHVDMLTVGIDGVDTTWDFEPSASDPAMRTVTLGGSALKDSIAAGGTVPSNDREQRKTQDSFLFKAAGQVSVNNAYQFTINLGYNLPYTGSDGYPGNGVRVVTWPTEHHANEGDYWAVEGYVERLRFGTNVPLMVWTDINHCLRLNM